MSFDPRRRRLLKTLVVAATALPFASRLGPAFAADAIPVDEALFPQWLASGDPRPDRVLLWTRAPGDGDVPLRLQVALDDGFERLVVERDVVARADADHCLRVRVAGLQPGTGYHVRFLRETAAGWRSSPHGRTRTAPAPDAAVPVRFGTISCQAYDGRWYNTLHALLADPPDFLLHLGDAIYETAADPAAPPAPRQVRLDDAAGAVRLGDSAHKRLAARSLDNYRQLHRTYRSDALLRRLLAQVPLIATWDDHEYTDDCWQDAGTDSEGRADDRDRQRRRNAEQAYFEYTPVDIDIGEADADGVQVVDPARLFPRLRLWRELRFGRDLHLFVLDYRSARSDHLIPEDAFPGALACDAATLAERLPLTGIDPALAAESLLPYVDATIRCGRNGASRCSARSTAATATPAWTSAPPPRRCRRSWHSQSRWRCCAASSRATTRPCPASCMRRCRTPTTPACRAACRGSRWARPGCSGTWAAATWWSSAPMRCWPRCARWMPSRRARWARRSTRGCANGWPPATRAGRWWRPRCR